MLTTDQWVTQPLATGTFDGDDYTSSDTETVTAAQGPAISLDKSASPGSYSAAGEEITYTFTVENTGNVTLEDITITDALPGLSGISPASVPSLAPGATAVFTASYTITQSDVDNGSVGNTATATGTFDGDDYTSSDTETVTAAQGPAISLDKSASPGSYSAAGEEITYTFTVENTGNVTLEDITITDALPGLSGISPASVPSLAPGATAVFTASYTITQSDVDNGSVGNTATATGTFDGDDYTSSDTETVTAAQGPAISLDKSASPGSYSAAGEEITYTFTVENTGNVTLEDITITDALPGLSGISPASVPSLAPGATAVFTASYTITQSDVDNGSVGNTATATGTFDGDDYTSSDTETVTAAQGPAISLDKSASPGSYSAAGEEITYTFTVENTGNVTLEDITITDALPGLSGISPASVPSLAPGATAVFTASYTITQSDVDNGSVGNTATATGTFDGDDYTSSDTETVTAAQGPAISLDKSASPGSYSAAGEEITYTFTVENTGNVTLEDITITDALPGLSGISPASVPSLAPGATAVFTASYTITQSDVDNGSVGNTATATGTFDGDDYTSSDTETVTAAQGPAISLDKSASPGSYSAAGEEITYTFTVENTGNVTLEDITITDALPGLSGISPASVPSLAPGATAVFTASYTITQSDVDNGSVGNTATATGTFDGDDYTSSDTETVTAAQGPAISLDKSASPGSYSAAGEEITYTFTVENTGNVTLEDITITDALPGLSGISPASVPSLAPGATAVFTASYTITQSDVDNGSVGNTATATGTFDGDDYTSSDTETVTAAQGPAISLDKSASPGSYSAAGEEITYTFTVENTGNVTLEDITITDALPGLSGISPASVPSLAPGATAVFTASYTITQSDVDNGSVGNTATATGTFDGDDYTSSDTETVTAAQGPAISLDKSASPGSYSAAGEEITYTFTVENTGNVTLEDITITDALPGLSGISPASVPSLAPGATAVFTASYTITQSDVDNGSVGNTATATGTFDGDDYTSSDTETVTAAQGPAISLDKSASPGSYSAAGEEITYTFTVENTGNVTLEDITITDALPGLSGISPASVPSLAPGATAVFTASYTITQSDVDNGSVGNTATATGTFDGDDYTSSDTETVTAAQGPAISLDKSASPGSYSAAGEEITYTFTVENTGNVTLEDITITDALPGLSGISPASVPSLAPGATAVFTASYTITQSDVDNGSVGNTATATGTFDGDDYTSSDTETVTAAQGPAISLDKSASPGSYSAAGEEITYTFTVENTGNVTLEDITITDALPGLSGISPASVPSLAPGATAVFTASYTITQSMLTTDQWVTQPLPRVLLTGMTIRPAIRRRSPRLRVQRSALTNRPPLAATVQRAKRSLIPLSR
jgi:uncharacterized repeat protein (TIGR01451 family)